MELTEFLLARLAEDEAVARSVQEVTPKSASPVFTSLSAPTGTVEMSPARVLAEVEAKRRIVEWLSEVEVMRQDAAMILVGQQYNRAMRLAVRALAAVYADHPDYRETWRP